MFRDLRIEHDVRAALRGDPRIKHPELITISADEIGTVVLRGAVGSFPQRLAAAHDARQVDGVLAVIADGLTIHPPSQDRRADDQVRAAALERLISDSRIHSTQIDVKVSRGHVTLVGSVRDESEGTAAVEDVAEVTGVLGITSRIEIG